MKADKADVTVKIVKIKFHFDNLFSGDKALGDLGNTLVNQNTDLFIQDIEPALQNSLCKLKYTDVCLFKCNKSLFLTFSKAVREISKSGFGKGAFQCILSLIRLARNGECKYQCLKIKLKRKKFLCLSFICFRNILKRLSMMFLRNDYKIAVFDKD